MSKVKVELELGCLVTCPMNGMFNSNGMHVHRFDSDSRTTGVLVSHESVLNPNPNTEKFPDVDERIWRTWRTVLASGRICHVLEDELELL